eukprot:GILI01028506.1.p1 GENE.GILI01028506.1~~GILI01028506.1.p1  ORF type:complete len:368 (-),score=75.01 GILI01028506.1:304-1407(-)
MLEAALSLLLLLLSAFLLVRAFQERAPTDADLAETEKEFAYNPNATAFITGGTSGIGLAAVHRLAKAGVRVFLGCRNVALGEKVVSEVMKKVPHASVEIVKVDTADPQSCLAAAKNVLSRVKRLDYLLLNAGAFPGAGLRYGMFLRAFATLTFPTLFETGHNGKATAVIQPTGLKTPDGLGLVFSTNVFGHFLLVEELMPLLKSSLARVIFTGSRSCDSFNYSPQDLQLLNCSDPYGCSKYQVDLLVTSLNSKYAASGVKFFSCCPGLVVTNAVPGLLHLFQSLVYLLRCFNKNMMISPDRGCEVLLRLCIEPNVAINPSRKYVMSCRQLATTPYSGLGDSSAAATFFQQICTLRASLDITPAGGKA